MTNKHPDPVVSRDPHIEPKLATPEETKPTAYPEREDYNATYSWITSIENQATESRRVASECQNAIHKMQLSVADTAANKRWLQWISGIIATSVLGLATLVFAIVPIMVGRTESRVDNQLSEYATRLAAAEGRLSPLAQLDTDALARVSPRHIAALEDLASDLSVSITESLGELERACLESLNHVVFSGIRQPGFGDHLQDLEAKVIECKSQIQSLNEMTQGKTNARSASAALTQIEHFSAALDRMTSLDYEHAAMQLRLIRPSHIDSPTLVAATQCMLGTIEMIQSNAGTQYVETAEEHFNRAIRIAGRDSDAWIGTPWNGLGINRANRVYATVEALLTDESPALNPYDLTSMLQDLKIADECFRQQAAIDGTIQSMHRYNVNTVWLDCIRLLLIEQYPTYQDRILLSAGARNLDEVFDEIEMRLEVANMLAAAPSTVHWARGRYQCRRAALPTAAGLKDPALYEKAKTSLLEAVNGKRFRASRSPAEAVERFTNDLLLRGLPTPIADEITEAIRNERESAIQASEV